jgi:Tol biopolymer transport system component
MPVWTRDGSEIFFTTGERTIYRVPADRSRDPTPVYQLAIPGRVHGLWISPDRKWLLTHWDQLPDLIDLRVLELGPPATLNRVVGSTGTERDGQLSPDGRWLVYQSEEATAGQEGLIMVRPFPDVQSRRWAISPTVGRQPIWSSDGSEIFYRTEDGAVMSVPIRRTPHFTTGTPVRVIAAPHTLRDWINGPTYDVSLDGRRFLFIRAPELDIRSLNVVLNWDIEVKASLMRRR